MLATPCRAYNSINCNKQGARCNSAGNDRNLLAKRLRKPRKHIESLPCRRQPFFLLELNRREVNHMHTIRSTYTPDGQRLELNECGDGFAIFTRWQKITRHFERLPDAIAAFEVLEFCEGDLHRIYRQSVSVELARTRAGMVSGSAMSRTLQVLKDVERRETGMRPLSCGSKGSVIKWVHS